MGSDFGMLESHDGANSTDYVSGVALAVGAPLMLATAASKTTVLVGGLLGVGLSRDFGATFEPTPVAPEVPVGNTTVSSITTQDIKYEAASGLFGIAGPINGFGSVAVSADDGSSWTVKRVVTEPPLINPAAIRYASFPSATTWYATAGFWGDDGEEDTTQAPAAPSRRLSKVFEAARGTDGAVRIKNLKQNSPPTSTLLRGSKGGRCGGGPLF